MAIRALSPAVNPTTAVQVLGYIDTYLRHLSSRALRRRYGLRDRAGRVRVIVPGRGWEEYLQLAVTEIRTCGDTSIQVSRRLGPGRTEDAPRSPPAGPPPAGPGSSGSDDDGSVPNG
jgi:uncharacterized membrane protein